MQTTDSLQIDILDSHFTKSDLTEYVQKTKKRKATDYDGIPAKVWKMFRYMTFHLKYSMKLRMRKISFTGKL
jgi:hypothetical protein